MSSAPSSADVADGLGPSGEQPDASSPDIVKHFHDSLIDLISNRLHLLTPESESDDAAEAARAALTQCVAIATEAIKAEREAFSRLPEVKELVSLGLETSSLSVRAAATETSKLLICTGESARIMLEHGVLDLALVCVPPASCVLSYLRLLIIGSRDSCACYLICLGRTACRSLATLHAPYMPATPSSALGTDHSPCVGKGLHTISRLAFYGRRGLLGQDDSERAATAVIRSYYEHITGLPVSEAARTAIQGDVVGPDYAPVLSHVSAAGNLRELLHEDFCRVVKTLASRYSFSKETLLAIATAARNVFVSACVDLADQTAAAALKESPWVYRSMHEWFRVLPLRAPLDELLDRDADFCLPAFALEAFDEAASDHWIMEQFHADEALGRLLCIIATHPGPEQNLALRTLGSLARHSHEAPRWLGEAAFAAVKVALVRGGHPVTLISVDDDSVADDVANFDRFTISCLWALAMVVGNHETIAIAFNDDPALMDVVRANINRVNPSLKVLRETAYLFSSLSSYMPPIPETEEGIVNLVRSISEIFVRIAEMPGGRSYFVLALGAFAHIPSLYRHVCTLFPLVALNADLWRPLAAVGAAAAAVGTATSASKAAMASIKASTGPARSAAEAITPVGIAWPAKFRALLRAELLAPGTTAAAMAAAKAAAAAEPAARVGEDEVSALAQSLSETAAAGVGDVAGEADPDASAAPVAAATAPLPEALSVAEVDQLDALIKEDARSIVARIREMEEKAKTLDGETSEHKGPAGQAKGEGMGSEEPDEAAGQPAPGPEVDADEADEGHAEGREGSAAREEGDSGLDATAPTTADSEPAAGPREGDDDQGVDVG